MTETICLITAPVSTDYEDPEDAQSRQVRGLASAPKLGVLALASVLEHAGWPVAIVDLDYAYADYLAKGNRGLEGFPAWVLPRLTGSGARLFGFSSICSSYPITIRLAGLLKRAAPDVTVLLGGPQASVVDLATLNAFPFVDFVLRGEADLTLPVFMARWSNGRRFADVPGLTWRSPFGPQRNADAPVIEDLDALPLPAYHLCDGLNDTEYAFLELGRGCPFACNFCSTNDFFRRKFRVRSPERVLADMRLVASMYGFSGFNLVHDMFTVDRRKVAAFCQAMIESGEGFRWSCSARTDCVDEGLLELMARAGCEGVFFGVETGSKRMQQVIGKDLDQAEARRAVETVDRLGMEATVSTIIGFPEETEQDLRETVDVFMHAMVQPLSLPQVNVLAPLSGTPVHTQYRDHLALEDLSSSLSYPGRSMSESDRALVRQHRDIFPNFYLLPTSAMERGTLQELAEFLPMTQKRLRWLMVAVYRRTSDLVGFFQAWRSHRMKLYPGMEGGALRHYYRQDVPVYDLVAFVREHLGEYGDDAVEALVTYEETLSAAAETPMRMAGQPVSARFTSNAVPLRAPDVRVIELDFDLQNVIDSLRGTAPLSRVPAQKFYRTHSDDGEEIRIIEIAPLVARALMLCDGVRTVRQFEEAAGDLFHCADGLRAYAARSLLRQLQSEGMIQLHRGTGVRSCVPADAGARAVSGET